MLQIAQRRRLKPFREVTKHVGVSDTLSAGGGVGFNKVTPKRCRVRRNHHLELFYHVHS